ncbi:MAG: hypothetical protein ACRD2C_25270 [Acidimicrobiales bacterium]
MADDGRQIEGDIKFALLTGAVSWRDRYSNYDAGDFATMAVLASGVAGVVTVFLVSAGLPGRGAAWTGNARWFAAVLGSLTLVAAVTPTMAWPFGRTRRQPSGHIWPVATVRVAAVAMVVGCWCVLLGTVAYWPAWILGGVVGAEVVLTARSLGVRPGGWEWLWWLERSSVHVGVLVVCAILAVARPDARGGILVVLVTFQVIALAIAGTCSGLMWLRAVIEQRTARKTAARDAAARSRLGEWIHTEVAAGVALMRRKLNTGTLSLEDMSGELMRFEQSVRLRQLQEMLSSGQSDLAGILQHYIRQAQQHGVTVADVPGLEVTGVKVDSGVGELVQRVLGVLVPNALSAGTSRLTLRIAVQPDEFVVEVEDDAGGFDLTAVPAERGLDRLRRLLGSDAVMRHSVDGGSCMRVRVPANAALLPDSLDEPLPSADVVTHGGAR